MEQKVSHCWLALQFSFLVGLSKIGVLIFCHHLTAFTVFRQVIRLRDVYPLFDKSHNEPLVLGWDVLDFAVIGFGGRCNTLCLLGWGLVLASVGI